MELAEVKHNLNKMVLYRGSPYLLTACILREAPSGEYFYQAELQDIKAENSLVICRLEDIKEGNAI